MRLESTILASLSDAYLQVGVWVAVMVWLCGWLRERPDGQFARLLAHPRLAPWVGALLGVSPGCGGAVVVMPLYVGKQTTFGAVIATLIATMGDSSFVMLAARPKLALAIHAGLFLLGGLCGSLVDALKLDAPQRSQEELASSPLRLSPTQLLRCQGSVGARRLRTGLFYRWGQRPSWLELACFWLPILFGLAATIALSFFQVEPERFGHSAGLLNLHLFGALGALEFCLLAALGWTIGRRQQRVYPNTARGLAVETLHETAPVVVWVTLSFVLTAVVVEGFGLNLSFLQDNALWCVGLGALVGLIPGCGPQIVLTSLYVDGVIGLPVLLANAVSQDGDALLPLIAKHPRAASRATLITTIPALLVGLLAWALLSGAPG